MTPKCGRPSLYGLRSGHKELRKRNVVGQNRMVMLCCLSAQAGVVSRVVFSTAVMLGMACWPAAAAPGAELRPATNAAYDRYVALTDQRNNHELQTGQNLLW